MFPTIERFRQDFRWITQGQSERLLRFYSFLGVWNEKMSLVSKASMQRAYASHFADSLHILEAVTRNREGLPLSDVGTGGGFPGVIQALLQPEAPIVFFEKSPKKQTFLQAVVREFGFKRAKIEGVFTVQEDPIFLLNRATFPPNELFDVASKCLPKASRFNVCLGGSTPIPPLPEGLSRLEELVYQLPEDAGMRKLLLVQVD